VFDGLSSAEGVMADFKFGPGSLNELKNVHQDLVAVVNRSLAYSVQDFAVHDGIRSLDQQKSLFAKGAAKTLDSRHITGHAVDLVPYINGKLRWEWPPIFLIAEAMRMAAKELDVKLRWGGAWDIDFTDSEAAPEDLMIDYGARIKKQGKHPFLDGPHFELKKAFYPA
jgi:peptidoglycan L-alanyl-D-glutamate endopeptidase CwlK